MIEAKTDESTEKDPIAWIEMERYGDIDEVKYDLKELSDLAEFEITLLETENSTNSDNGTKVVKAYTDTFEKIPKDKLSGVKEWLFREIFWARHVCNAKAKIEEGNGCKNLTKNISKKEEKNNLSEQTDTQERNSKTNKNKDQSLPPSSVKRIENLNFQILEELRKIRETLENSQ